MDQVHIDSDKIESEIVSSNPTIAKHGIYLPEDIWYRLVMTAMMQRTTASIVVSEMLARHLPKVEMP